MMKAYLFSGDSHVVEVCRKLAEYEVRLTVSEKLNIPASVDRSSGSSFILLDDALLRHSVLDAGVKDFLKDADNIPVLVISRENSPYLAIEYIKNGFADYACFPFSAAFLWRRIKKMIGKSDVEEVYPHIQETGSVCECPSSADSPFASFIGETDVVRRLKTELLRFSQTEFPICLFGETGTGKNLLAGEIWKNSLRSSKPYIWENLGALPAGLASGAFFGTKKGTFTGAENLPGLFESAQHGTVFLDEIECATPEIQQALLCISDKTQFKRVNSHKVMTADIRIICASNANLKKMVKEGLFREDLFFRLTWLSVRVPALRERMADLPLLADAVLEKAGKGITSGALKKLMDYDWPGNVRELNSCLNRACVLSSGSVVDITDIKFAGEFNFDGL